IISLSAHIRTVPREDVGGGVEVVLGEIDGGAGFAEAGGDQFQLAGEGADVAGGENAGAAGLHHAVHLDLPAFDLQVPVFYRTEVAVEADVDQDVIDVEHLLGFATVVVDDGLLNLAVAGDGLELVKGFDVGGRLAHFGDAVFMGAELIATVNQSHV